MTSHRPPAAASTAPIIRTLPGPGEYMCGLTWDGQYLWHSDQALGRIFAIDPADGTVARTLDCASVRADLAFDGNWLCQVGRRPKRLVLVDREGGDVVGQKEVLPASGRLTGVEMGPEGLWLCLRGPTVLQLRDYASMTVRQEFPVAGETPSGLTYALGAVLYGDYAEQVIRAIDPETGAELGVTPVPGHPTGLAWDGEHVWYCDFPARALRALSLEAVLAGHRL